MAIFCWVKMRLISSFEDRLEAGIHAETPKVKKHSKSRLHQIRYVFDKKKTTERKEEIKMKGEQEKGK